MEPRAIVIMYSGRQANDAELSKVIADLTTFGVIHGMTPGVIQLGPEEIAKEIAKEQEQEDNAVEKAAYYLFKNFETPLRQKDYRTLPIAIVITIMQGDENLRTAIQILSEPNIKISAKVKKEYHITNDVLSICKYVNSQV